MGVPGFFLWLLKQYRGEGFVFKKSNNTPVLDSIDELLIDANCFLHPQCFKILAMYKNWEDKDALEALMIEQIEKYLEHIVQHVDPQKLVYISIDGPAPMAKIKQQRLRRFKSYNDHVMMNNIKKKFKEPIHRHWNNSAITPGTPFMHTIHETMIAYIKKKKKSHPMLNFIYSSPYTPGEGEHKLLDHLRTSPSSSYVIYGLDADLIFLSLSTHKSNIFLLRENIKSRGGEELEFVSIDTMRKLIQHTIDNAIETKRIEKTPTPSTSILPTPTSVPTSVSTSVPISFPTIITEEESRGYISDFIFICYLLGNDFLPSIPSLSLYSVNKKVKNGLDTIVDAYASTMACHERGTTVLIIEGTSVQFNHPVLSELFHCLSEVEDDYFKTYHAEKHKRRYIKSDNTYDTEVQRIETISFKTNDPIQLGLDSSSEWKYRYYEHYYHATINQSDTVTQSCIQYLDGMAWIAQYYFKGCASWTWSYVPDHAPFMSDLATTLKHYKIAPKFTRGKPLKPLLQLLTVLPPQTAYLLPPSLRSISSSSLSNVHYMYPHDFNQDVLYKHKYFQAIPLIPHLNIELVKSEFDKVILSKSEKQYNKKLSVICA